eukprot:TRINITY_DN3275_c0_g1_i4.p1 TRINITY_DN3275_c0_g1~~TRINITY_DN3275_c0_g1_i4.p1  ORF type:complete len:530 (-),score=86.96 TRINITY_DN3275_c0_g1_i4:433-1944(-)
MTLLNFFQLFAVISVLGSGFARREAQSQIDNDVRLWEIPWLKKMLLTVDDFRDLACNFNKDAYVLAFLSPGLPLFLFQCTGFLEIRCSGLGLKSFFTLLGVFMIGGVDRSVKLVTCQTEQRHDGNGRWIGEFQYNAAVPSRKCDDALLTMAGSFFILCYGLVVPLCIVLVVWHIWKARARLPASECSWYFEMHPDALQSLGCRLQILQHVSLPELNPSYVGKDADLIHVEQAELTAAAAHSLAMMASVASMANVDFTVSSAKEGILALRAESAELRQLTKQLPELLASSKQYAARARDCAALRCSGSDRLYQGSKSLMSKYSSFNFVCLEALLKVYTVMLAAVVEGQHGFSISIAMLLIMSSFVAMAKPFASQSKNRLQSVCYLCLGLGAASLSLSCTWPVAAKMLVRACYCLPVLLAVWQVKYPDIVEALAPQLDAYFQAVLESSGDPSQTLLENFDLTFVHQKMEHVTVPATANSPPLMQEAGAEVELGVEMTTLTTRRLE